VTHADPVSANLRRPLRAERRRDQRYATPGLTALVQGVECALADLSLGGCRVLINKDQPPLGRDLTIALALPVGRQIIHCRLTGRVVRRRADFIALYFERPPAKAMLDLHYYIRSRHG